jgi:hypothetical protein
MSDDLSAALALCGLAAAAIVVAAIFAFQQKVYVDAATGHVTSVEVPGLGKFKTNTPAIALCGLGVILGYFAYDVMKGRSAKLVKFQGEINLDQELIADIDAVTVGVTSGSWSHTSTPNGSTPVISVEIPVPDSWPSYATYAFALGSTQTRPVLVGARLEDPKFKLSIRK